MNRKKVRPVALAAATAMLMTPLVAMPAAATPEGDNVVINEVSVDQLYAELYNPSDDEVALDGLSFAYYAQKGGHQNGTVALSGTMEPNGYYLVGLRQTGSTSGVETDVDWDATSQVGANGGYAIVKSDSDYVNLANGDVAGDEALIDFYGVGNSVKFETQASPAKPTASQSAGRTDGVDTDNNAADFSPQTPTPTNSNGETAEPGEPDPEPTDPGDPDPEPTDPGEPVDPDEITPIADIQGSGANSPLAGQTATTQGYVTATYPTGGKNGIYIQSAGTGGTTAHEAPSEAVFVYGTASNLLKDLEIGDFVQVKGLVNEFNGSTQITVADKGWSTIEPVGEKPEAVSMDRLPIDEAGKEALEGMLVDFTGPITVTDNYQNGVNYGEIGVAFGDKPLRQPSDVYNPTRDGHAALEGIDQDNAERLITIDDGRTTNWSGADNKNSVPLPYISNTAPVRTGAEVELVQPAVVEYSFNKWRLQPVEPATTEDGNVGDQFFAFENDRPDAPAEVGGDVTLSGFNVLNYFTTTAADVNCTSTYKDRQGNPITANSCNTVRGAADGVNLARQQVKIVSAINTLDSDVVSLEEIENSAKNNKDRDAALETLTDALNAADSSKNWEYVKSPSAGLPSLGDQDVIRTAFIYQADSVTPVGESKILNDQKAFSNAREPLAQEFVAIDANGEEYGDSFVAIVNHFKSKGSGTAAPDPWQGNANNDRVAQADALGEWANEEYPDTAIFVIGDLNAYSAEDPILKLNDHGYTRVMDYMAEATEDDSYLELTTYQYQGKHGSLDQALGNDLALEMVTDAEVYAINAPEAIALEYSRYNNYLTIYHDETQYRSSDHDPVKIGLDVDDSDPDPGSTGEPTDPTDEPSDPGTGPSDPGTDPTGDPTDGSSDPSQDPSDVMDDHTDGAAAGDKPGDDMPNTGAQVAGIALAALLLVAAGVVLLARRRMGGSAESA